MALFLWRGLRPVLLAATWLCMGSAHAQGVPALKAGEQIYQEACVVCHGGGIGGAPALGNRKIWAPLIGEGQVPLTVTGWLGIRGMPAKGGREDLSLEEFARATAWMARSAGAKWSDPDAGMLARMGAFEQKRLAARAKRAPKAGS